MHLFSLFHSQSELATILVFFALMGKIRKDLSASLTKFISVWLLPEFSGHWLLADPVWWWFFVSRDDAFGHSHLATENERRTVLLT